MKGCHFRRTWDSPYWDVMDTYMHINRLHRMILERELNRTGVYRSQHQLLMFIADNPNASQKDIARLHRVSTATVAVSLKKLEQGGYIRRLVDQSDNRCNQLTITEKGQDVATKSAAYFQKVEKQMFSGFSEEELETLRGFLTRICHNLKQMVPEKEREG